MKIENGQMCLSFLLLPENGKMEKALAKFPHKNSMKSMKKGFAAQFQIQRKRNPLNQTLDHLSHLPKVGPWSKQRNHL